MKKVLLCRKLLKQAVVALPAAALLLSTSHAAQIGINFEDEWGGDGGAPVVNPAFGLDRANWYNMVRVLNSESAAFSTNQTITLPEGGTLLVEWSAINTYSVYADVPTNGNEQVTYGYLDDTGAGYKVVISGFRNSVSSYAITLIAASDSASGFSDALIAHDSETNSVQFPNPYTPDYTLNGAANPTGLAASSTLSGAISPLSGNNRVTITGLAKNGTLRSCLAGLIIEYTPGGSNPPEFVAQPQSPTGTIFSGQSFSLSATASGSPTLAYQWRKNGTSIDGATSATLSKSGVTGTDTGNYDVVVTNAFGAVTSAVAQVTITDISQPVILAGPVSQSFYTGYPVTFTVQATGGALSYQWKKNTQTIPNATNTSLTLPSITSNDQGNYTVEVSNPVGPTASASATLTVKTPTGNYEAAVAQTKPLLWFRNSDATASVQDVANNSGSLAAAGNGLYIGTIVHLVDGALAGSSDAAVTFAGGRASVPYSDSLNPDSFTVEAWLKPATALTGTTLTCPLSSVHIADPRAGWLIYQSASGWNFRTYNQNSTATAVSITGGSAPVAGQWYHVVASWDNTTGIGRVYINGVLSATSTQTNYVANTDGAFAVGARSDGAFVWSGVADEVAHYSTVLSEAQILAHYQNGTNASRSTPYNTLITTDGAVEYLRLNEPAFGGKPENAGTLGVAWNGSYTDAGGVLGSPAITAGAVGPRPPEQPGLESTNLAVAMSNGYVSAPLCTNLNVNTLTVAGWLKPEEIPSSGDLGWPCWLGDGGMHIENTSGRPTRELRYHWKGSQWGWSSGLVVPADAWTFVAMVVTPSNATFYMSDGTTLKSSVNTATHAALAVSSPLGFGGNQPGRADRTYKGSLDEFTVYDRTLTLSEINTLFMVGTGAKLGLTLTSGGIIEDTKPLGTLHHGYNFGTPWSTSSTDANATPRTRTGVQQFSAANGGQIAIPSNTDFDSPSGTICFWMRFDAVAAGGIPGPGSEAAILVDRRTSTGAIIGMDDGGAIYWQGQAGSRNALATGYVPDGNWHHVAVSYGQTTSDAISIYIDGALSASAQVTNAWSWPTSQQIELGRSHDGYWKRFDGQMDDFRIYNRALTEVEIGQIYVNDALVDTSALKLLYRFTTPGIGHSIAWPFGTLESSPSLNPGATWTPVSGAVSPWPFLSTEPSLFFRARP